MPDSSVTGSCAPASPIDTRGIGEYVAVERRPTTRGGHLELRQRSHGVVHVVQRITGALCGARGVDYMTVLDHDIPPREVMQRAEAGADWCRNCLRWVARW